MKYLHKNLRLIRLVANKTQPEFGAMFNASKSMIASYEQNKADPDELFIARVCRFAGITEKEIKQKLLTETDIFKDSHKINGQTVAMPPPYMPPSADLVEERALIYAVVKELIELKMKVFGLSRDAAFFQFAKNATLGADQIRAEIQKQKSGLNVNDDG